VTILDANLLLYAYNADAPEHDAARAWVHGILAGRDWVGLAWLTIWAFLRISTNPRLFLQPLPVQEAFGIVRGWLAIPNVVVIQPGPRHADILELLAVENQASGPLLTDAALAAMAIEQGTVLASTDRDFSRFPRLQWLNPLEGNPRRR
jgi:toxin-antitoxin system PIN domain toxin